MSLFGSIMSKIFHKKADAPAAAATPQAPTSPTAMAGVPAPPAPADPHPEAEPVDVEAVLSEMAEMKGGGGNWRTSIVDLLKLLDIDSSLQARRELGQELGVHAGEDGSAEQNIALSKAVWAKLAENGGVVPDSLRH